jgi:dihydrolipoamide dehydrogenase
MANENASERNHLMSKKIVIIGGGPGGYVAAIRAAQLGAKVDLVEKEYLGGTCLNVGCIPTKALLHAAETFQAVLHGAAIGLKVDDPRIDWPAVSKYKAGVVNRLVKGVESLLKANGVTVHRGHAHVKDATTVMVNGTAISADAIILATGSEPAKINFPGADLPGVIDSTGALVLEKLPGSLAILGGGVIGVEFASMYNAFGCKVTVIEMLPQILPGIDGEIAQQVRNDIVGKGVNVLTGAKLTKVAGKAPALSVTFEADGQAKTISTEAVLVAVGRRPRTQGMGLEEAGIAMERGRIIVDEHFATNIPGIYAIGDCSSPIMLAHVASAQGIAAVEDALGHPAAHYGHIVPACIYTHPEVAAVGLTEEQAKAQGIAYKKGVFQLAANGKSLIESGGTGMIKVIAGAQHGEILGVHIFGPRATDLITEGALAMRLEATVDELVSTIHAHPTVGEAMAEAALAVDGIAIHWPPAKKPALAVA